MRTEPHTLFQVASLTAKNRYPQLFGAVAWLLGRDRTDLRILSYECAAGEECFALRERFPAATIVGVDANPLALEEARKQNEDERIFFVQSTPANLERLGQFDVVLALSVLCRWPATRGVENCRELFPYQGFEDGLETLDSLVRPGGLLVIYNSTYRFADAALSDGYSVEKSDSLPDAGIVTRFDKDGSRSAGAPDARIIFRKNASSSLAADAASDEPVDDPSLARELQRELSAAALLDHVHRLPLELTPAEWRICGESMIRWLEIAGEAELQSGAQSLLPRIVGGGSHPKIRREISGFLEEAVAHPATAARPEWLLASGLLGAEAREKLPRAVWAPLLARVREHLFAGLGSGASNESALGYLVEATEDLPALRWTVFEKLLAAGLDPGRLGAVPNPLDLPKTRFSRYASLWAYLRSSGRGDTVSRQSLGLYRRFAKPRFLCDAIVAYATDGPDQRDGGEFLASDELAALSAAEIRGVQRRVLKSEEVPGPRFFEVIARLAELPAADVDALWGFSQHFVVSRLEAMSPVDQTEWLLGLPNVVLSLPAWAALRVRLVAESLERQSAPVVLEDPGRITPGDDLDVPAAPVERLVQTLLAGGFEAAAIPWAEYAVGRFGSEWDYQQCARALLRAERNQRAREVLEQGVERYPKNGVLRMAWAKAVVRLGRHADLVQAPGGESERIALGKQLFSAALGSGAKGRRPVGGEGRGPAGQSLREQIGIDELVPRVDVAAFRQAIGSKVIGAPTGAPTGAADSSPDTRWLMLGYQTLNIGDEIQAIAATRFLPRVDGLLDRDDLAAGGLGANARAILNGWYLEPGADGRYRWPPATELDGLWVSVHFNPVHAQGILTPAGIDYLRATGKPIGCRDAFTLDLLRSVGVAAQFTGCLTLTLPRIEGDRQPVVCFTDLNDEVDERLAPVVEGELGIPPSRLAHLIERGSLSHGYQARLDAATELLAVYASASLVVTSRLHAALPCYAMGTPVVMISKDPGDLRFGEVLDPIPRIGRAECLRHPERVFELARRPREIPSWTEALAARVREFVGPIG